MTVTPIQLMISGSNTLDTNKLVAQRQDSVRNLLTTFIDKICNNVEIEPRLQPLDNERFNLRSAVTSSEARLDIKAGGF